MYPPPIINAEDYGRFQPPIVDFEWRAVEDRQASSLQGHTVYTDVAFAIIQSAGTRDTVERDAEKWLAYIQTPAARWPEVVADKFVEGFKRWKEHTNTDAIVIGTPVAAGGLFRPSEQKALLGANVRTIEQTAGMTESTMGLVGMGARELKKKAADYLERASNDTTRMHSEVMDLQCQVKNLEVELSKLRDINARLEAKLSQRKSHG